MLPTILARASLADDEELDAAGAAGFSVVMNRAEVSPSSLVIGRYSVLPYYAELEADLRHFGSRLINSAREHRWIADLGAWYPVFEHRTPRTWLEFAQYRASGFDGPVVLKGRTNSRKQRWRTSMYAANPDEASRVFQTLLDDDLLCQQGIVVREYEEFDHDGYDVSGMPITNEHRVFVLDGRPVSAQFYWAEHADVVSPSFLGDTSLALEFVTDNIAPFLEARFVAVDVAWSDIGWRLVELNDGQMSGLGWTEPATFYKQLREAFERGT